MQNIIIINVKNTPLTQEEKRKLCIYPYVWSWIPVGIWRLPKTYGTIPIFFTLYFVHTVGNGLVASVNCLSLRAIKFWFDERTLCYLSSIAG